jgi:hypothetical protein
MIHLFPSPLSAREYEFLQQSTMENTTNEARVRALAKQEAQERARYAARLRWIAISAIISTVVSFTLGLLASRYEDIIADLDQALSQC